MPDPARVLIVDDSRIFRAALETALAFEEDVRVVGSVFSGEKALAFLQQTPADLVTLDVEMPGMDGLQTLEAVRRWSASRPESERPGVIMLSAFTRHGADVTIRALQSGAFDFVPKPSGGCEQECLHLLRTHLLAKIRSFMCRRRSAPRLPEPSICRLPRPSFRCRAVVVATSTGGPEALSKILPALAPELDVPMFVVQHMPAQFTCALAEHLTRQTGARVVEARDGEIAQPRTVYIAPGGKHLLMRAGPGGQIVTAVNEQPPENGFRPSADVLFRSAAATVGGEAVAVVLTGMACDRRADGTAGLGPLKRAGAYVIAQDEASSVVWGMPGSVVRAGLADAVLPLAEIPAAVRRLACPVQVAEAVARGAGDSWS